LIFALLSNGAEIKQRSRLQTSFGELRMYTVFSGLCRPLPAHCPLKRSVSVGERNPKQHSGRGRHKPENTVYILRLQTSFGELRMYTVFSGLCRPLPECCLGLRSPTDTDRLSKPENTVYILSSPKEVCSLDLCFISAPLDRFSSASRCTYIAFNRRFFRPCREAR
jgi:hypothetical protein